MANDTGATRMRCGCGFELAGAEATIEVFNEHVCTDNEVPPRWHESVFSYWGMLITALLVGGIALVAGVRW